MAGYKVVSLKVDSKGAIDMLDLKEKTQQHKDSLACLMITFPSTFGVFDEGVQEVCKIVSGPTMTINYSSLIFVRFTKEEV